ncbi:MAG: DUF3095 family protein, partial [Gemmatimonadetes bacterium]
MRPAGVGADEDFYGRLPTVDDFAELTGGAPYHDVPGSWHVVVADVRDSTTAIARGRYKAVNTVGVSVIAAVRNVVRPTEVPYLFGGDGALLCVPATHAPAVRDALAATVAMARDRFGLELRAAMVPVARIREAGRSLRVARHRVSPHYVQCAFEGDGADWIEAALKRGALGEDALIAADPRATADFSGLECRWHEVRSPADETVALIVEAPDGRELREVVTVVERVFGEPEVCRPVREDALRPALSRRALSYESAVKGWRRAWWARLAFAVWLRVEVVAGWWLMRRGTERDGVRWGEYKRDLVANTDFRKFDGRLRFVLSGTREQRERLE